jgi:hypothetical protein
MINSAVFGAKKSAGNRFELVPTGEVMDNERIA